MLSLTHLGPAKAQSPGVNLAALVARLSADETTIADQQALITFLKNHPTPGPKGDKGDTGPQGVKGDTGPAGTGSIAALTQVGKDVFFTGVNVHIVSGSGSTTDGGTLLGLGNLILGYNALGNDLGAGDVRTGSHNLVLGDFNNYSSYGGLVTGSDNAISGRYASVSGGAINTASGPYSSVSGGRLNAATNFEASVSGGDSNTASGDTASVSGGQGNTASGFYASVSGGRLNAASGDRSSVSGGSQKMQNAAQGWTGGTYHTP